MTTIRDVCKHGRNCQVMKTSRSVFATLPDSTEIDTSQEFISDDISIPESLPASSNNQYKNGII